MLHEGERSSQTRRAKCPHGQRQPRHDRGNAINDQRNYSVHAVHESAAGGVLPREEQQDGFATLPDGQSELEPAMLSGFRINSQLMPKAAY